MWIWKCWSPAGRTVLLWSVLLVVLVPEGFGEKRTKPSAAVPIESNAVSGSPAAPGPAISPGSLYDSSGVLGNLSRDMRAAQLNDLVTIEISDKASALSKGATTSGRKSQVKSSIASLAGPLKATSPLASLADLTGQTKLDGQGSTSRETELRTTVSARVVGVLPNGNLVVSGVKEVMVNSERQRITIRGVVRWNDVSPSNRISSDRLADLEIRVDGKGVVNDAIRRPGFLYRLLMGLLPF